MIAATTPTGSRSTREWPTRDSKSNAATSRANEDSNPSGDPTCTRRENSMGAPISRVIVCASVSPRCLRPARILESHSERSAGLVRDQSSKARLAAARAMGAIAVRADDPQLQQQLMQHHGTSSFFGMPMPGSTLYFEATGVRAVFESIVALAGPGSRIGLTGVHKEAATVDLMSLLAKEVAIIPAMGYENEFDEVIAILQSGKIDPTVMVTHRFPLSDIGAAFAMARDPHSAIKVMIDCQA